MVILYIRKVFVKIIPAGGSGSSVNHPYLGLSCTCTAMELQSLHKSAPPDQSLHSWPLCWTATELQLRSENITNKKLTKIILYTDHWFSV